MKQTLLLSIAFLPALSAPALAQESDEPQLVADTVFVTAPGKARSAAELIGNANAIARDDLLETLDGSLGDTLDHLPGVASTSFGAGAGRPVLRGLGSERVQVLTNGIGVIDASAASPDHQVSSDGIDADKVEILRGPAALAYGGQAIGGVVNVIDGLISEDLPEDQLSVDGFFASNSVNEGLEGAARVKATAGAFVFSLSAAARDFDEYEIPGFAESAAFRALEEDEHDHEDEDHDEDHEDEDHEDEDHDDDHDHEEEEEAYGLLPNSQLETQALAAGLSYVGEKGFIGVAVRSQMAEYGLPGHAHHHHEEEHDEEEHEDEEDHDEDEDHDHEEGEESPFIDLEHLRFDLRAGLELDAGPLNYISGSFSYADYEHTEIESPDEEGTVYESEGYEGRIELDHEIGGFEGALGVQILDKSFNAEGAEAFITPTDTQSYGVFLYEARDWENGAGIEGGLRFDSTEYDNEVAGTRDFSMVSASLGAHRHWDNGFFIGAQAALTERAPNETELFADGVHSAAQRFEVGNSEFDVEQGLNLEAALRYRDDRFQFGINIFRTNFSDFIYARPGETIVDGETVDEVEEFPVYLFEQEDADFTGGEIYGELLLGRALGADWSTDFGIDLVNAKLDSGENVPLIPPATFNLGADAEWRWFSLGADVSHAADQNDVGEDEFGVEGFTRLDLRAGLALGGFAPALDGVEAFAELRNATDEEIRPATSVIRDLAPLPGRNLRIGVKLSL